MKRFYIGSLELLVNLNEEMDIWQWDEKFTRPVMPVSNQEEIEIHITADLPAITGKEYRVPGMAIYENNQEEWRIYGFSEKSIINEYIPEVISHHSRHGKVKLFLKQDWWQKNHRSFRPWFYMHMEELLLENRSMILHSASIIYRNSVLLFTAPSGTGKTTQTDLWHQYLDGVEDLNGDRTLIQYMSGRWYGSGFPVFGSTIRCEQKAAPLKAVIILRQGTEDKLCDLSPVQKLALLYSEITVPHFKKDYIEMAMGLIEELIQEVPVFLYSCTMQESAVTTLHQSLYGGVGDGTI